MIDDLIQAAKIVAITAGKMILAAAILLAVPACVAGAEHLADSLHEYLTSPATANTLPPTYAL